MPHDRQASRHGAAIRTSVTHPLQIAAVSAGAGRGRVGITFCPGKCQPHSLTGAWARDLGLDVAAIADWGAASVVTLVEDHELVALGVAHLGAAIRAAHMDWHHLAIRDVSVPTAAFETAWQTVGPALRDQLRAGFDVLVHCKGGLGRAGMVAALLLVECGWQPPEALAAVRAARPGAVETSAQETYVRTRAAISEPPPQRSPAAIRDRCRGALLGLAVGDAIGTTLEFSRRDGAKRVTDMVGGGPFGLQPGEWTDDTAMALALADARIDGGGIAAARVGKDIMSRHAGYSVGKHIGVHHTGRHRFRCGVGGAALPCRRVGKLAAALPVADRHRRQPHQRAIAGAHRVGTAGVRLPGAHEAAERLAGGDADIEAAAGAAVRAILPPGDEATYQVVRIERTIGGKIVRGSWRGKRRHAIHSSGYVAHSLEAALWCVGRTSSFADAVLLAANLGDDADTTAAITGQLAGALYGVGGIPETWLERLAWRDRLTAAADALVDAGNAT